MSKKKTITELYNEIIVKALNQEPLTAEHIEFLQDRADMVANKNANRKPTKAQEENEKFKKQILEFMSDGVSRTATDIQKGVGMESNQKTSALLRQLILNNLISKTEIKGRSWFTKV